MVGWNVFGLAPPSAIADGSDIAAVSMSPGHMEAFFIGPDGQVIDYFWRDTWNHFSLAPPGSAAAGGIAAVSRGPDLMEVWWITPAGTVEGSWWAASSGTGWHRYNLAPSGRAAVGSKIRAVSKYPGHIEVYWISPSGSIEAGLWLDDGKSWRLYQVAPPGSAALLGGLTAVSREPKAMEIWWVGADGSVQGSWAYDGSKWNHYTLAPAGSASVGAGLRAQARLPNVLNMWWISPQGSVEGCFEVLGPTQKWTRYQIAGNGSASLSSGLFSLHRQSSTEELFWVSPKGAIMDAYWYDTGKQPNPWQSFRGTTDGSVRPNSSICAISRYPGTMETWYAGPDGGLGDRFWYDLRSRTFTKPIVSGGLAALGGSATMTIKEDGTMRWNGYGHDSGADSYEYGVVGYLRPKAGSGLPPIVAVHHGSLWVHWLGSKHRDDSWDVSSIVPDIQAHYDDYAGGDFELDTQYNSGLLNTLESVFNLALKWSVGSLIDGIGIVIFIGVEVGSLVATGSLVAGARILNNVLFMAGPGNTLLAIAAGGIASAGSRSRMLTQAEYDFANREVFMSAGSTSSTLPPREKLFITDTKGMANKAFTFPMSDGTITINVGGLPGMFENPGGTFASVFIHELVHAWQIAHTPIQLSLLASALASQLRGSTSYNYPAAGPAFKDFNLEQQAQIVQEWWTGQHTHELPPGYENSKNTNSPYYRYIVENIQSGTYS